MLQERQQVRLHGTPPVRWFLPLLGWLLTAAAMAALYLLLLRPDLRCWAGVATHGNPVRPAVALTFDDGPHPLWTPLLADTLERHGAHGAFFLVGFEAQRYPELTARLARGGHQIGNHSLSHPYPNLTRLPRAEIDREIRAAHRLLQQLSGQPVRDFRPPGGGMDDAVIATLQAEGLRLALWSMNAGDWDAVPPAVITARVQAALRPGQVVLLHQREQSITAVEDLLADYRHRDYTYLTFEAILRH